MIKNGNFPGSNNGTGLLQTIIGLKVGDTCCFVLVWHTWASCSCFHSEFTHPSSPHHRCLPTLYPPTPQVRDVYERITQQQVVPVSN
jgi:hypothetical protein